MSSASRHDHIRAAMERHVEAGSVAGLVWAVSTPDETSRGAAGTFGPNGTGEAVQPNTLFRLSSVTKPIVAAAVLTLVDDGTMALDDPVDRWLPELADRRVLVRPDAPLTETVPASRPILVQDVFELRLGLGYDFTADQPSAVLAALEEAGVHMGPPAPQANPAPDAWMKIVGRVPLMYQPGERWLYNIGAEVLGVLAARAAGSSLPSLLRERLLDPLGMSDTAFHVSTTDRHRLGPVWKPAQDGEPSTAYDGPDGQWSRPPAFPNAADGLVSTVDDVAAVGALLLGAGTRHTEQVLKPGTIAAMTTDRTGPISPDRRGWGLGIGVLTQDEPGGRHARSYGWDGGLGSSWWNDPVTQTTAVLLTNRMWADPTPPQIMQDFWTAAFGPL